MAGIFGFRPNTALADTFLAPRQGNEAYWRAKLANQGSVSKARPSLAGRLEGAAASTLRKAGVPAYRAARLGSKTFAAINDLTPVGNATMAADAGTEFSRGNLLSGTGLASLAVLPGAAGRMGKGMFGGIRAWHGSPYSFDRFDWGDAVRSTGEGAQGYGDGLYFAESRRLANAYRNAKMLPDAPPDYGALYEVNINAKPDDFVDWDAPLSRQPGPIQDLARNVDLSRFNPGRRERVLLERFAQGTEQADYPALGHHLHSVFTDYGADTAANRRLSEIVAGGGFAGFRFGQPKDALGGGGRNYVVFDPSIVDILNRY